MHIRKIGMAHGWGAFAYTLPMAKSTTDRPIEFVSTRKLKNCLFATRNKLGTHAEANEIHVVL